MTASGAGFVYLVGAGPGDPRLLTMRAHELVRAAEVVAYDELVAPAILALAPDDAERLAVGRRAGGGPTSYRLHPAVLARAQAGQHVVRLKCGDPMIFGRGGEEAEELAAAGVGFEIVPGVSAALGAAAYAGIPLTHRACASSVRLTSGHVVRGADGGGGPGNETLVVYMAGRRIAACLAELITAGWPATTPAAWIAAATTRAQQVVTATLADLARRVADEAAGADAPALLVVGDVVAHRTPWWEAQPLAGRRVLVARARPGRSRLAAALRALGAEVIEAPTLELGPALDVDLDALDHAGAIGFGCAAGVDAVLARRALPAVPVVAIGQPAAQALARHGVAPRLTVDGACRAALGPVAAALAGHRLLVVTGTAGRPALLDELAQLGVATDVLPTYRVHTRRVALAGGFDLLVLPSSSAARLVLGAAHGLGEVPAVAIGARTEATARALGVRQVLRAEHDSIASVLAGVQAVAS